MNVVHGTRAPAAYIRKSKRADDSAAAQLAAIRALATRDGLDPDALIVYDDNGRSGDRSKLTARRGYTALIEAAQRDEVSVVYARVIDRLGRDTEEGLRLYRVLQEHGVDIVDEAGRRTGEDGKDRLMLEMWVAERELRSAKQRSAFTKRQREARGDVVIGGHGAPYGYMHVRAGDARLDGDPRRIVRVPNPAEPIQPLLDAVEATRGNILQACKRLNEQGVPSRGGKGWVARTLARVLDGHDAPRARRGAGIRRWAPGAAPLSRLVACHCGRLMTPVRDRRNGQWLSLVCGLGHRLGVDAHGPYVARSRHIIERLKAELAGTVTEVHGPEYTTDEDAVDVSARRASLEEARRRAGVSYRAGAMDDDDFGAEMDRIKDELVALDQLESDVLLGPVITLKTRRVHWEALGQDDELVGYELRQHVRLVKLGLDMRPVAVEMRGSVAA